MKYFHKHLSLSPSLSLSLPCVFLLTKLFTILHCYRSSLQLQTGHFGLTPTWSISNLLVGSGFVKIQVTNHNSNTIKSFNHNSVFRTECGHPSLFLTFDSSSPYISFSLFLSTRFVLPLYTFHSSSSSYFILPLHTFHSSSSSPHTSLFLSTQFILPLHSLFFHPLFFCHLFHTKI